MMQEILAFGQVCGRRKKFLIRLISIQNKPSHPQTPTVSLTWVVCKESNSSPSTRWHTDCVPLYWVNKVEVLRILVRVEVPKSLADDKEIEPVKMKRMAFCTKNASVLHHQLYAGVIT